MKIIVLGDTHIPKRAKILPQLIKEECKTSDLIIHVGDWQTVEVYEDLKAFGKVEGVFGNVDSPDLKKVLAKQKLLFIQGKKIGIIHGDGKGLTTERRALAAFKGQDVDCILFGHSHIPLKKYTENGTLIFNPGSATDKRKQRLYSCGILHITDEVIHAEHLFFEDKF